MKLRLKAKIVTALVFGVAIIAGLYLEKISRVDINRFYPPDNRIVYIDLKIRYAGFLISKVKGISGFS